MESPLQDCRCSRARAAPALVYALRARLGELGPQMRDVRSVLGVLRRGGSLVVGHLHRQRLLGAPLKQALLDERSNRAIIYFLFI